MRSRTPSISTAIAHSVERCVLASEWNSAVGGKELKQSFGRYEMLTKENYPTRKLSTKKAAKRPADSSQWKKEKEKTDQQKKRPQPPPPTAKPPIDDRACQ